MSTPLPKTHVELLDQQVALTQYLESLLCPTPMSLPVPVVTAAPPIVEVVEKTVVPVAPPVAEDAVIVAARTETAPASITEPVAAKVEPAPAWAEEPFAALLLKVNGLMLALPLVTINRILPFEEPSFLPGYASWLLGIVHYQDSNVRVVDTAALVMPELDRRAVETVPAGEDTRRIVLIDEGRWGLVCESVSEVITLDPSKIRWRTSRTKRPWLAGTLVEQLCALLDVQRLSEVLRSGCPDLPGD